MIDKESRRRIQALVDTLSMKGLLTESEYYKILEGKKQKEAKK